MTMKGPAQRHLGSVLYWMDGDCVQPLGHPSHWENDRTMGLLWPAFGATSGGIQRRRWDEGQGQGRGLNGGTASRKVRGGVQQAVFLLQAAESPVHCVQPILEQIALLWAEKQRFPDARIL